MSSVDAASARIPDRVREALLDFRKRLDERFGNRLKDFRLFGSYARGDWGPDSDVDVLVVVSELVIERERREIFELGEEVFFDTLVHLSPFVLAETELTELRRREYRIVSEIDADGVVP